jgi:hypothetical protein
MGLLQLDGKYRYLLHGKNPSIKKIIFAVPELRLI